MEKARENYISWDECFMRMAHVIAERSKDPSTQAGSVITDKNNIVVGLGYNGFPRGVESENFPWDREGDFVNTKYAYVCHSEENAIYNSHQKPIDGKIYCTLFPCNECAKAIVQNQIKEVIFESDKYHDDKVWIASRRILDSAGVKYRQYISDYNKK
jgi:dCMP deaminase